MKFLTLFAAGALAATPVARSPALIQRDIAAINSDLAAIQSATETLGYAAGNYTSVGDRTSLLAAADAVSNAIAQGLADAKSTGNLTFNEAATLVGPVNGLSAAVQNAVNTTINNRAILVSTGLGGQIETQLLDLQSEAGVFSAALIQDVPESLQSFAGTLAAPISAALQRGVDAFNGTANAASISLDLQVINNATELLTAAITAFQDISGRQAIVDASADVIAAIKQGIQDAKAAGNISVNDAVSLINPTNQLAATVDTSINATIAQNVTLITAGLGGQTESTLLDVQANSNALSAQIVADVPDFLQSTAANLAAPIAASIQRGVDAFNDTANGASISVDLYVIKNATDVLTYAIGNLTGPYDGPAITADVNDVLAAIAQGLKDAISAGNISVNEAVALINPTNALVAAVNASVTTTINAKANLTAFGLACDTYKDLTQLQAASNTLSAQIVADVPDFLQSTAANLAAPIAESLQKGVDAFTGACSGSTTTSTSSTSSATSTISSSSSSTSSVVTTTSSTAKTSSSSKVSGTATSKSTKVSGTTTSKSTKVSGTATSKSSSVSGTVTSKSSSSLWNRDLEIEQRLRNRYF